MIKLAQHQPLLEIKNLSVSFNMYEKLVEKHNLEVISDLSIDVQAGQILAIVGSSGSGKSLLANAILGILPNHAIIKGKMFYKGKDLTPRHQEALRGKEMALVPQSVSYLNPLMKVAQQVIGHTDKEKRKIGLKQVFKRLGLDEEVENMYPHQLSGGMAKKGACCNCGNWRCSADYRR